MWKIGKVSKTQLIITIMKSLLTFQKFSWNFLGIVQTSSVRLRWTLVYVRNLEMYRKIQHKFSFFVKSEIQYKLNFADVSIFHTCVITITKFLRGSRNFDTDYYFSKPNRQWTMSCKIFTVMEIHDFFVNFFVKFDRIQNFTP